MLYTSHRASQDALRQRLRELAGCATTGGNVSSGIYSSPLGNFTVPVPAMGFGAVVQEHSSADECMVAFHDDFGGLRRIDCWRLPAAAAAMIGEPDRMSERYSGYMTTIVLPGMEQQSPGAAVLDERFVGEDEDRAYFCVVEIPGGSTLMDVVSGRGPDSRRGFLVFARGGFMYLVVTADDMSAITGWDPSEETFAGMLEQALRFRLTIEFK
jgi:hypothetical protein